MWQRFNDYYLNLVADNDRTLGGLLDTLDELALWYDTVVLMTADHGDLAGSHGGLRGKGPFPFEAETHVPLVVVHPDHPGGRACAALSSHIDLLPTLIGLTGAPEDERRTLAGGLPGRDLSTLLAAPEAARADALRPAVLFNYVSLQTVTAHYLAFVGSRSIVEGHWAPPLAESHPDLARCGFVSFVFDGRHKYARYYAPADFHAPTTLDEILGRNDVELFDLEADPDERNSLALDPGRAGATLLAMNDLLNEMIADEVGVNDGGFLPEAVRPRP